jgi:hypothetical protein
MDVLVYCAREKGTTKHLGIIERRPPRSPDLSPPNVLLWHYLKGHVYDSNPHTIEDLKTNIPEATASINQRTLRRVAQNMVKQGILAFRRMVSTSTSFFELYFRFYCILVLQNETSVAF